jgi:hypothetical protein
MTESIEKREWYLRKLFTSCSHLLESSYKAGNTLYFYLKYLREDFSPEQLSLTYPKQLPK